jgi:transposase InsO family protein
MLADQASSLSERAIFRREIAPAGFAKCLKTRAFLFLSDKLLGRSIRSTDVIAGLTCLMHTRGIPEFIRCKFRDESLNREWFQSYSEAEVLVEQWRQYYNTQRPHSALGYQTPTQFANGQKKS